MIFLRVKTKHADGRVETLVSGDRDAEVTELAWVVRAFMGKRDLTEITFTLEPDKDESPKKGNPFRRG